MSNTGTTIDSLYTQLAQARAAATQAGPLYMALYAAKMELILACTQLGLPGFAPQAVPNAIPNSGNTYQAGDVSGLIQTWQQAQTAYQTAIAAPVAIQQQISAAIQTNAAAASATSQVASPSNAQVSSQTNQ